MGGYGSGVAGGGSPKETVEDCTVLSAAKLQRDDVFGEGRYGGGRLAWIQTSTGEEVSSIGYLIDTLDPSDVHLRLRYNRTCWWTGEREWLDYEVGLTTTPLPWGGVRWWFVCPLFKDGWGCARRCGKLYLPPGGRYFCCRLCYDLTYRSAQEAHRFDRKYAQLAAEAGLGPGRVRGDFRTASMNRADKCARFGGTRA